MKQSETRVLGSVRRYGDANDYWGYFSLFGIQTLGAVVLLWNGLPLYRTILADPGSHHETVQTLLWAIPSIVLMQIGYWVSRRFLVPDLPIRSAFLGHLILFSARMVFVFATSVFGFVFILAKPEFEIPVSRYVVTVLGLFSLYCYVLEMERLGRGVQAERIKKPRATEAR
jgi:hypothetical protein